MLCGRYQLTCIFIFAQNTSKVRNDDNQKNIIKEHKK